MSTLRKVSIVRVTTLMLRLVMLIGVLALLTSAAGAMGQKEPSVPLEPAQTEPEDILGDPVYVRFDPEQNSYFVPPPEAVARSSASQKQTTITVNYLEAGQTDALGQICES